MNAVILFNLVALWLLLLIVLWLLLNVMKKQNAAVLAPAGAGQGPGPVEPLAGKRAPAFRAWTMDQQEVGQMDFQKHETLFLFLSTTCPHCRNVVPEIERVGEKLQRRGGKVALVFEEPAKNVGTYYESLGLSLPVLVAPQEQTTFAHDYNRRGGVPAFVAMNASGFVTHEGVVNVREEAWRTFVQEWQVYPLLSKPASFYR